MTSPPATRYLADFEHARDNPQDFWGREAAHIRWLSPPESVLDTRAAPFYSWLKLTPNRLTFQRSQAEWPKMVKWSPHHFISCLQISARIKWQTYLYGRSWLNFTRKRARCLVCEGPTTRVKIVYLIGRT